MGWGVVEHDGVWWCVVGWLGCAGLWCGVLECGVVWCGGLWWGVSECSVVGCECGVLVRFMVWCDLVMCSGEGRIGLKCCEVRCSGLCNLCW